MIIIIIIIIKLKKSVGLIQRLYVLEKMTQRSSHYEEIHLKSPYLDSQSYYSQWVPPPPHFVMLLKWQSSVKVFSQIWQYSKYESRIILSKLSCCRQLWENLAYIYIYIYIYWRFRKGSLRQNIFFSKYFTENGENSPQNNSLKLLACHQNMAQFPNFSTFLRTQNWLSPLVDDCAEDLPFTKFEKEKYTLPANKVESCFFWGGLLWDVAKVTLIHKKI